MDIWDLGRTIGRRWRIAVPIFLLSLGMTAFMFTHIKPDYISTAYVQLVPPVPPAGTAGQTTPDLRNPWLGQDLRTLGNAALVTVQDLGYVQSLKDAGYSDSFTAVMSDNTPLITFQVTGKSADQAKNTADQLIGRFDGSVSSLQTSYGATSDDLITGRRLDAGTNVTISTSNVKRAVLAVLAVGILLTLAITVGLDAWLRRRSRAKTSKADAAVDATPVPAMQQFADGRDTATLTMARIFTSVGNGNATNANNPGAGGHPGMGANPRAGHPGMGGNSGMGGGIRGNGVNTNRRPPTDREIAETSGNNGDTIAIRTGFNEHDMPADATVILPKAVPAKDN